MPLPLPAGSLQKISLNLPNGTPLRIALDQRTRVDHPGRWFMAKLVETVYAFDQPVIPAGSIVSGQIISIKSSLRRKAHARLRQRRLFSLPQIRGHI